MTRQRRRRFAPDDYARHRARFLERWVPRSIGFNDDQSEVLRAVAERYRLSLSEIVDRVFAAYIPHQFGMEWPRVRRDKHRWRLQEHKLHRPYGTQRVYGLLFSQSQDEVLASALEQLGIGRGGFAAMTEDALTIWMPQLFRATWPEANRLRVMPGKRPRRVS